jgi:hypothetical protein
LAAEEKMKIFTEKPRVEFVNELAMVDENLALLTATVGLLRKEMTSNAEYKRL